MLQQVLDEAEGRKSQSSSVGIPSESESIRSSLQSKSNRNSISSYGATLNAANDNADGDSYEQSYDDDENDYSLDDESAFEEESVVPPTLLQRSWSCLKNSFFVVANVENLWDSPPDVNNHDSTTTEYGTHTPTTPPQRRSRKSNLVVLFWFVVLATSYSGERSTFKLLVDRAGPFRLFAVEMVTGLHAIMLGLGMGASRFLNGQSQSVPLGIPVIDVGLMALLDTVSLLLVFLTGSHVPPTLTVILVQFTIPLTAFLSQFVHPDGKWTCCRPTSSSLLDGSDRNGSTVSSHQSPLTGGDQMSHIPDHQETYHENPRRHPDDDDVLRPRLSGEPLPGWGGLAKEHVWGSIILALAVLLALIPAFICIVDPDVFVYADTIPIRTAYNTLIFVSSCIPAAASQLYKEHIFVQYKQPVNAGYLNLLLSIFQFTFASVMSPLIFGLMGLGAKGDWTKEYPSTDFSENFLDGLLCFFRILSDDDQLSKYAEDARCDHTLGLAIFHAISIICVGVAVDKIVNAGATKVMYRGISAGIIVAVLTMHSYDMRISEFNYGPAVDGLNLVSVVMLILGAEVYHRVNLQGSTFETTYAEIPTFYDEE
jgi:hypothetical protein